MSAWNDSPPDSWYIAPDEIEDDDEHDCRGVWCLHPSHRDTD